MGYWDSESSFSVAVTKVRITGKTRNALDKGINQSLWS